MTVLIVDDLQTDALIFSALLGNDVDKVFTVECPLAGLIAVERESPFLVLVDYVMPSLDGVEFVRRLRRMDKHGDTPVVMVTSSLDMDVRLAALEAGATDFMLKPIDPYELRARVHNLLRAASSRRALLREAASLREEIGRTSRVLRERETEIISRLELVAKLSDPDTGSHIKRSASLARSIAEFMGFETDFCWDIYTAMHMHDIGKIGVSDAILNKPGPLTQEERAAVELHVAYGAEILGGSSCALVRFCEEIAVTHHERWDGSGYPAALKGAAIPVSGRIAAVSDVFDALTSSRPYKKAWSTAEALAHMRNESGRLFDPACVAALMAVI